MVLLSRKDRLSAPATEYLFKIYFLFILILPVPPLFSSQNQFVMFHRVHRFIIYRHPLPKANSNLSMQIVDVAHAIVKRPQHNPETLCSLVHQNSCLSGIIQHHLSPYNQAFDESTSANSSFDWAASAGIKRATLGSDVVSLAGGGAAGAAGIGMLCPDVTGIAPRGIAPRSGAGLGGAGLGGVGESAHGEASALGADTSLSAGTQNRPAHSGQCTYPPAFLLGTDSDRLHRGQSILMGMILLVSTFQRQIELQVVQHDWADDHQRGGHHDQHGRQQHVHTGFAGDRFGPLRPFDP